MKQIPALRSRIAQEVKCSKHLEKTWAYGIAAIRANGHRPFLS
jgi:hypothetical protein